MDELPRHQCLIYEGSPARHLPALVASLRQKLDQGYRCLYLNSAPMVAGMRSYLAAAGVDVEAEIAAERLLLSSQTSHLVDEAFDVDRMLDVLDDALAQAIEDGFAGLWATGDMSWEFGPQKDFTKLLEYEWRLEAFFRTHPRLSGICQYHRDLMPDEAMCQGLAAHPVLFVNETLSRVNPHYLRGAFGEQFAEHARLSEAVRLLCRSGDYA